MTSVSSAPSADDNKGSMLVVNSLPGESFRDDKSFGTYMTLEKFSYMAAMQGSKLSSWYLRSSTSSTFKISDKLLRSRRCFPKSKKLSLPIRSMLLLLLSQFFVQAGHCIWKGNFESLFPLHQSLSHARFMLANQIYLAFSCFMYFFCRLFNTVVKPNSSLF